MFLRGDPSSARFCLSVPPPLSLPASLRERNQVAEFPYKNYKTVKQIFIVFIGS